MGRTRFEHGVADDEFGISTRREAIAGLLSASARF